MGGRTHLAPVESCFSEDAIKPFILSLLLDQTRAGHDHSNLDVGGNLAAGGYFGRRSEVFNSRVGA